MTVGASPRFGRQAGPVRRESTSRSCCSATGQERADSYGASGEDARKTIVGAAVTFVIDVDDAGKGTMRWRSTTRAAGHVEKLKRDLGLTRRPLAERAHVRGHCLVVVAVAPRWHWRQPSRCPLWILCDWPSPSRSPSSGRVRTVVPAADRTVLRPDRQPDLVTVTSACSLGTQRRVAPRRHGRRLGGEARHVPGGPHPTVRRDDRFDALKPYLLSFRACGPAGGTFTRRRWIAMTSPSTVLIDADGVGCSCGRQVWGAKRWPTSRRGAARPGEPDGSSRRASGPGRVTTTSERSWPGWGRPRGGPDVHRLAVGGPAVPVFVAVLLTKVSGIRCSRRRRMHGGAAAGLRGARAHARTPPRRDVRPAVRNA